MRNGNEASTTGMRKRTKGRKIRISVSIIGCASILLA